MLTHKSSSSEAVAWSPVKLENGAERGCDRFPLSASLRGVDGLTYPGALGFLELLQVTH